MKKTKRKNPIRFLKRSKYIESDYKEDLTKIVDKLKEKGYRDARIISDTLIFDKMGIFLLKLTSKKEKVYLWKY